MKEGKKLIATLILFTGVLLSTLTGCGDDDDTQGSIVGKWEGQHAEAEFSSSGVVLFEQSIDPFEVTVEFKEDGTAVVDDDGTITEGTWEKNGNTLSTTVNLGTGDFGNIEELKIKKLTATDLVLTIKKDTAIEDSGFEISGTIRGTASFSRLPD